MSLIFLTFLTVVPLITATSLAANAQDAFEEEGPGLQDRFLERRPNLFRQRGLIEPKKPKQTSSIEISEVKKINDALNSIKISSDKLQKADLGEISKIASLIKDIPLDINIRTTFLSSPSTTSATERMIITSNVGDASSEIRFGTENTTLSVTNKDELEREILQKSNQLSDVVKEKWSPNTPVFKCYADYIDCRGYNHQWYICAPALWICCTGTMIPAVSIK